jgi:hypothetical protein
MARRILTFVALGALVGCSPSFDPPSKVQSLRVLAVQKDKPYAHPGDTVKMSMLIADDPDKGPRPLHIAWLPGQENPLGDSYLGSFVPNGSACKSPPGSGGSLTDIFSSLDLPVGTPIPSAFEQGFEFSQRLSSTIVSCRPPPQDPKQVPYGTEYVFFVVCAGDHLGLAIPPRKLLEFNPTTDAFTFPIGCFTKDNVPLGSDDFVAGYTELFGFDNVTNNNPVVTGFQVDDQPVTADCVGSDCVKLQEQEMAIAAASRDAGAPHHAPDSGLLPLFPDASISLADAGTPGGGGLFDAGSAGQSIPGAFDSRIDCSRNDPRCIDVCTTDKDDDCPKHTIDVELDRDKTLEHNTPLERREGGTVYEQQWVNYYADRGKMIHDVKLLSDATLGWAADHSSAIRAPKDPGPFHVWAVAHDNRGGAAWIRIRLVAR